MNNLFQQTMMPLNQLIANSVQAQPAADKSFSANQPTRILQEQPPREEHLVNPKAEQDSAVFQTILQRFLHDFEYVRLDDYSHGSVLDPSKELDRHPHFQFVMCNDDLKALTAKDPSGNLVSTYLSRQIDRGTYLLKKIGLEVDEFYVNEETGILQYDVKVPAEKITAGSSEHEVLKSVEQQLQQACDQARSAGKSRDIS